MKKTDKKWEVKIIDFDSKEMKEKIEKAHIEQQRILDRKKITSEQLKLTINI